MRSFKASSTGPSALVNATFSLPSPDLTLTVPCWLQPRSFQLFKPCVSCLMLMKSFLKTYMQEFTFIPLYVFSPLFQPVKIFLNLSAAIRSINNPSGFVSTANLISASSLLLHPNCRKKGGGRPSRGLSRGGTVGDVCGGDAGPIVASTAPVPPGRPLSLLVQGLRGFEECLTGITTLCPLSNTSVCPSCSCCPFRAGIQGCGSCLVSSCRLGDIVPLSSLSPYT